MSERSVAKNANTLTTLPLDSMAPHWFTALFYFALKRVARCDDTSGNCIILSSAILSSEK